MERTNSHIDGIVEGDNVWVTQGKTDHMATFLGKPRKVFVHNDSQVEDKSNLNTSEKVEYEAMIRWATTGTTSYVEVSTIRLVVLGQRRRRQVVSHYQAVPSQRPGAGNNKRKRKEKVKSVKQQHPKEEKEQPSLLELNNLNEEKTRGESDSAVAASKKSSGFRFNLPTQEEFQKYQEKRQGEKEKKKRKKELNRKRKRDNKLGDGPVTADNTENIPTNSDAVHDDCKPMAVLSSIVTVTPKQQQSSTDTPESASRWRISDSDGSAIVLSRVRKHNNVEDLSSTIDRGFPWEWETPETSIDKTKESVSNQKNSIKLLPKNYGKGKPRSWAEAYSMMAEFQRGNGDRDENNYKCEIPSDHPFLGKFATDLRSEYIKFRKHAMDQKEKRKSNAQVEKTLYRSFDRNSLKDMTRVDRRRVQLLKNIGFRWRVRSEKPSPKRSENDSETEDEIDFGKVASGTLEINSGVSISSLDDNSNSDDLVTSDLNDDDIYEHTKKCSQQRKNYLQRSAVSSSSSSPSSSSYSLSSIEDDEERPTNNHKKDFASDDKLLIVSKLYEIDLSASYKSHRMLATSKEPTFPIQLYRLLRFSALNPKLGFNKIIRWNDDGNGFRIAHEKKFVAEILIKVSNMTKAKSYRNAMTMFCFVLVEYGLDKRGCQYRIYKHQSVLEAEEANDPSLRLFYRGAPLEKLWKIRTRKEENVDKDADAMLNKIGGNKIKSRKEEEDSSSDNISLSNSRKARKSYKESAERRKRRTSDGCLLPKYGAKQLLLKDGTYKKPNGKHPFGLEWDKIRGLWAPSHPLPKNTGNNHNHNDNAMLNKIGGNKIKSRKEEEDSRKARKSYHESAERRKRRTSDGCLLPKYGAKQLLLKDGTYKKPNGKHPFGLEWDKIRGLWAPSHPLPKNTGNNHNDSNKKRKNSDLYGLSLSERRTSDGCLVPKNKPILSDGRYKIPLGHHPRYLEWDEIRGLWAPIGTKNDSDASSSDVGISEEIRYLDKCITQRRTRNGCFLPRRKPIQLADGTYMQPGGKEPKNLKWDEIQGLWVPEKRLKKRKFSGSDYSTLGEDATIIKASKAKLFQHSSSILRKYFQPKKNKRRHGSSMYHSQRFQARTKSNPSGIIEHTINLSNWRKIEKLMRRSSGDRNMGVSSSPRLTTEEEVLV